MKRISLISNSSLQYYKFKVELHPDFHRLNKIYFHQPYNNDVGDFIFDPLVKVVTEGEDFFYRKQDLVEKDLLVNDKIKQDADLSDFKKIDTFFETNNIKRTLKQFKKKWIPLPFFKENSINRNVLYPTDWVRMYFNCDDDYKNIEIVFAIDTTLAKNEFDKSGPQLSLNPNENIFKLHTNDINIRNFLFSTDFATSWIVGYVADLFYGENDEMRLEQPFNQYVSNYLLLLKWVESLSETPEFQLYSDDTKKIPVDLVIDIGNASTCALLFENQNDLAFEFNKVKKIIIQDYSDPQKEYDEPFPMNLVFKDSNFGKINSDKYHNKKFVIPSFTRIGFEAENIINKSNLNLDFGRELKTYNSSPKRYLWDDKIAEKEWEFYPEENAKTIKNVYLSGISEQLKLDGSLINNNDEVFGSRSLFSRKSLMKFVFLELLIHAYVQINSYKFRVEHGNITTPRTLKRITISCPTAMVQSEQIALRQAAEDACKLLNNYVKYYFESDDNKFWFELPEIIPSIKDISKKITDFENRNDWMYDEATSCQLVFVYGLLAKKLKGHDYVLKNYLYKNNQKLTIASIDIGAGTTDLMIANYDLNNDANLLKIKPDPQFWDSFKLAGDDLLKAFIQEIIIEGAIQDSTDEGAIGIIQNYGLSRGIVDMSQKLNGFFGQNTNHLGYLAKLMRKVFIHQVAIPVAIYCLQNANEIDTKSLTFEQIINKKFENKELIKYFEKHFGFDFLEIVWKINPDKINNIVKAVFSPLVKQLSLVINQYQCQYVVLSGKPLFNKSLEMVFRKYLTASPNNIVNLNNFWIGNWFPFSDNNGFVADQKTMVGIGTTIALMSSKLNKINDMKLDIEHLKQKITTTVDYIVKQNLNQKEILLTPKKNENTFITPALPYQFGYSKYNSQNYMTSDLYCIEINTLEIEKTVKTRFPNKDNKFYDDQIQIEKNKINQNLPLKIDITRQFEDSKEVLKIERIEDKEGNDKPIKFLKLNYQTIDNENGYWLDTCDFILNIR